jgi:hypothetical protein
MHRPLTGSSASDAFPGTRWTASSGDGGLGMHNGAWETYWNIRADAGVALAPPNPYYYGPSLNFVGLQARAPRGGRSS